MIKQYFSNVHYYLKITKEEYFRDITIEDASKMSDLHVKVARDGFVARRQRAGYHGLGWMAIPVVILFFFFNEPGVGRWITLMLAALWLLRFAQIVISGHDSIKRQESSIDYIHNDDRQRIVEAAMKHKVENVLSHIRSTDELKRHSMMKLEQDWAQREIDYAMRIDGCEDQ